MPPEDFIERIDLLVNDENRIVSYKILSHELKIHVNKAKQCLADFVNIQKQKGIDLTVHYFLAGFVEKDGIRTVKVVIAPEDKLEAAKENFSEITSFHIYSIFNGDSKDECALYSADFSYIKEKGNLNKYAAIKHPNIEIQPPVLNKILINNDPKPCINKKLFPKPSTNETSSSEPKNDSKSSPVKKTLSPEKCDKPEDSAKESKGNKKSPEDKKQKTGTLMSMWQKKEEKTNGVKKENSKTEVKGKEGPKVAAKNSIMSMFSKQAAKNAEKPAVVKPPVIKEESPKKTLPVIEKEELKNEKPLENKKASQKRKVSNKNSKKPSRSKHDSDSDNDFETKTKKKRRRICTFDDSSSESEPEEEREKAQRSFFLPEDPMDTAQDALKSEDEEPIPPTPPVVHVKGKAKVWKTVQKTFEDEEGFFVTKTQKELVSASEDEEDPLKVKEIKKEEVVTKKSVSVNKKQASLMSFFKQK